VTHPQLRAKHGEYSLALNIFLLDIGTAGRTVFYEAKDLAEIVVSQLEAMEARPSGRKEVRLHVELAGQ